MHTNSAEGFRKRDGSTSLPAERARQDAREERSEKRARGTHPPHPRWRQLEKWLSAGGRRDLFSPEAIDNAS